MSAIVCYPALATVEKPPKQNGYFDPMRFPILSSLRKVRDEERDATVGRPSPDADVSAAYLGLAMRERTPRLDKVEHAAHELATGAPRS